MVIQKFNSLIRNKWVWGVFAVTVAAVFVLPDGCLRNNGAKQDDSAEAQLRNLSNYDTQLEKKCEELLKFRFLDYVHLPNSMPLSMLFKPGEKVKLYAAVQTFKDAGVVITDEMLSEYIHSLFSSPDKPFNPDEYKDFVKARHNISVPRFEEYLRLGLMLRNGLLTVEQLEDAVSSVEVKASSQAYSDKFTVSVAEFNVDTKEAEKVKVDNKAVEKWYTDNKKSLALPVRYKVRYVKVPLSGVATTNLLAKVNLSEESVEARYEENCKKGMYKISTTNDVEQVKPLKDVRDAVVAELKGETVRKMIKDNVYDFNQSRAKKDPNLLEDFVADNILGAKLKIEDAWLAFENLPKGEILDKYQENGFITDIGSSFIGVDPNDFRNKVIDLKEEGHNVIEAPAFLCLIYKTPKDERENRQPEPKLEDIKPVVEALALDEAKAEKFKATVEAVKDKGFDAVVKSSGANTNLAFQVVNMEPEKPLLGEYQGQIIHASMNLNKGEISDFILLEPGKALLVACQERVPGTAEDYQKAEMFATTEAQRRRAWTMPQVISDWLDWNLKRLGDNK